jgi:Abortive infection alpha
MRWERGIKLVERCEAFLRERGMAAPTRQVPLKMVLPLIEAASLDDSDELLDLWATLLVNAADADSGVNVTRRLISILQDFEPLEAKCLQMIASKPRQGISTDQPPFDSLVAARPEVEIALWNLVRLGCLQPVKYYDRPSVELVSVTMLGQQLFAACSKPKTTPGTPDPKEVTKTPASRTSLRLA